MARMIPPVIDPRTPSPGEKEIYARLRDDPGTRDWTVLHSVDIPKHVFQTVGEADFVVLIPGKAVVCIEVKGHQKVIRKDGAWYLGSDPNPDFKGPFKQAREAMESIRKSVGQKAELSNVPFTYVVMFPFVSRIDQVMPGEWLPWQLVTEDDLHSRSIGEVLTSVANSERTRLRSVGSAKWFTPNGGNPTVKQCVGIVNILRPDFELLETPATLRKRMETEIRRCTEEQFTCLDAMESNDRVIFRGPGGTGKTVLALEAARREAIRGRRVLLLCYNRLLSKQLSREVEGFEGLVEVSTIDALLLSIAGRPDVPQFPESTQFWRETLPTTALERLLDGEGCNTADVLIMDEAQDALRDSYIDVLDLVLVDGWRAGRWRIFGDFENQAIYGKTDLGLDRVRSLAVHPPEYELRVNCRNSPRISEFVQLLGGLTPGYTRVLRQDNYVAPRIRYYTNKRSEAEALEGTLDELLNDGFSPGDIVVLSPFKEGSCAKSIEHTYRNATMVPVEESSPSSIGYGTIYSFKGLESHVVILTDIDELHSDEAKALFYTGITRAMDRLIVLADSSLQSEVVSLVTARVTS